MVRICAKSYESFRTFVGIRPSLTEFRPMDSDHFSSGLGARKKLIAKVEQFLRI